MAGRRGFAFGRRRGGVASGADPEDPTKSKTRTKWNTLAWIEAHGRKWQSRAELRRYEQLLECQERGEICELTVKPRFELLRSFSHEGRKIAHVVYVADFAYRDLTRPRATDMFEGTTLKGARVVEDVKGANSTDPYYRLKKRMMLQIHGIEVEEVKMPRERKAKGAEE